MLEARENRRDIWFGGPLEALKIWCAEKFTAGQMVKKFKEEFGIDFTRSAIIGKVHRTPGIALDLPHGKRHTDVVNPNRGGDHIKAARIRRRPYKPPEFPFVPDEPEPFRVSLLDLTDTHCHWVCEGTDDHCLPTYCGHPSVDGRWCSHHYRRVYE